VAGIPLTVIYYFPRFYYLMYGGSRRYLIVNPGLLFLFLRLLTFFISKTPILTF
jgi:hypothetical protein